MFKHNTSNPLRRTTIATQSTYPAIPYVSRALALPTHPCFGNDPPQNVLVLDRDQTRKYNKISKELAVEAKTRLANHKHLHPELTPLIDNSILIVEDDHGILWHREGDLSFLMDSRPVVLKSLSQQLKPDIQNDYAEHQQAVWNYEVKDGDPFVSKCGRQAAIFPIFVRGMRFTVTVFFTGLGPDLI